MDYYLITIFSTVVSGTLIFVIGQIILKFFIEPIHKQKEVIGEIADALIYYSDVLANPVESEEDIRLKEKRKNGREKFRMLACRLASKTQLIPCYKKLSFFKIIIKKQNIIKVKENLVGLSGGVYPHFDIHFDSLSNNDKMIKELNDLLNLSIKNSSVK